MQIRKNFRKHDPKFVFKAKKIWKTYFELFNQGQNWNIGEKKSWGGEREIMDLARYKAHFFIYQSYI
jgi:hypothetical protein